MRLGSASVLASIATIAFSASAQAAAAAETQSNLSLMQAAYAGPADLGRSEGVSYLPGQGLVSWRSGASAGFGPVGGRHVDSLRIATASLDASPGRALTRPDLTGMGDANAFEFTYIRNWPAAFSVQAGRLDLDLTPHAGLGLSSAGSQLAEAGALVRLGARVQDRVLRAMGAEDALDGSRLFLYAGATRRAIGLNLLGKQALSGRANPRGDGSVREAQAGIGLKKGVVSASLGYTYERTRMRTFGGDAREDNRVGLTVAIRPRR